MAIVIEEEKPKVSIIHVLMWFTVLVVIGLSVYYIFFAKPEIADIVVPSTLRNVEPLAKITLNPEDILNSEVFQGLKQYVVPPSPGNAGRSNPFLPTR